MEKREKYKRFLLQFGYWAAILLIVFLAIRYLLKPLAPFLIALAVVMVTQPLVRKFTAKGRISKRLISVVLVIACYLIVIGLLALIIAGIVSVVVDWAKMFPDFFAETIQPGIGEAVNRILALLRRIDPDIGLEVQDALPQILSSASGSVMNLSMSVLSWASGIGTKLPGLLLASIVCVIATFFLALDYERISEKLLSALPKRTQEVVVTSKRALGVIVGKYLKSYSLILLITFAEIAVGLLLIGIDDAASIAALIAIFDFLPIVGSGMILAPWTIISFIQGRLGRGIGLAVLWAVVICARQFMEPKIVGKQVGLHPLTTLVCLWVGLKLGGALGMFALPIGLLILMELKEEGLIFIGRKEPEASEASEEGAEPTDAQTIPAAKGTAEK